VEQVLLSEAFAASTGQVAEEGDSLERALHERVATGQRAWPGVLLDPETFVRHLAVHVYRGQLVPIAYVGDLWLACGCARGMPAAITEFDRAYHPTLKRTIARVLPEDVDDCAQQVLESLLVRRQAGPPKIAEYGGRAALRSWLTIIAKRAALSRRRRPDARPQESVLAVAEAAAYGDPELELVKIHYAPELHVSLRRGLSALDSRQRVLLRLHHIDGWTIERLAAVYGVARSTAANWLNAARVKLLEATRADLCARLRLEPAELESLMRALETGLMEVSLARLLGTARA
jgi:RNA polymerase sigma-70 factor (ECF subfamily)